MRAKITRTCRIHLNGAIKELSAGETIMLPPEKLSRLISGGYAEPYKPGIEEYRALLRELGKRDPKGGCWEWIRRQRPEQWKEHLRALRSGDLAGARKGFIEMVKEWEGQGKAVD
jgi:hypothetical protein